MSKRRVLKWRDWLLVLAFPLGGIAGHFAAMILTGEPDIDWPVVLGSATGFLIGALIYVRLKYENRTRKPYER